MTKQIPQGYRQTKVGIIPDDWEVVKLGDIAEFYKGKGISKEDLSDNGIPCIRYGELYTIYNEKIDNVVSKTNIVTTELFLSNANDIIIPASGETAIDIATASCVMQNNIALGSDLNIIRTKYNGIFLSYYLNTIAKNQIASLAQGISVIHLYGSQLKTLVLSLPPPKEQEKIAEILSIWDDAINKQEQLIEEKQIFKKCIMQQIFNQQLCFKDDNGNDYPAWQTKNLGDFAKITTGSSNREDSFENNGKYTFFDRSQDIRTSNIYLFDCEAVIIAGEGQEFIPKYFVGKFDLHQRTYVIYDFTHTDGLFIYYYLYQCNHYFLSQAVGSTVKSLRLPMFIKMPIKLPSLEEQKKIAYFITSIDDEITKQTELLDQLKLQKQSLMQKLLTGRVRVEI